MDRETSQRRIAGLGHMIRPRYRDFETDADWDAHIDAIVGVLDSCRVGKERQETGGRDRMERGGRDRAEGSTRSRSKAAESAPPEADSGGESASGSDGE